MSSANSRPHHVASQIASVLEPFLERKDWTLHYPLYVNTFCLAYHLAALVAVRFGSEAVRDHFIRHDWAHGMPAFTYRSNIEIFVGVHETLKKLEELGHDSKSFQSVAFTGYSLKRIFVRKDRPHEGPMLLITDVRENAQRLLRSWREVPPNLGDIGTIDPDPQMIRDSRDRGLHDFFDDCRKMYLFSAPMEWLLELQTGDKYLVCPIPTEVIDTAYLFRCNLPISASRVKELQRAVRDYYGLIYSDQMEQFVSPDMANHYGRIANSSGQPNPFPEVTKLILDDRIALEQESRKHDKVNDELVMQDRYVKILKTYHERPSSEELL